MYCVTPSSQHLEYILCDVHTHTPRHTMQTTDVALHMMMCTHTDTCTTCAMNGVAVVCWLLCGCIIVVVCVQCMNNDDAVVVYCLDDDKMCALMVMVVAHILQHVSAEC